MKKLTKIAYRNYKKGDDTVIRCVFCDKSKKYQTTFKMKHLENKYHTVCRDCMHIYNDLSQKHP